MPIIGNVGRRSWKVRALNVGLHLILMLGAVTMVYPMMIMLTGSVKSAVDSRHLEVIPSYFYDDDVLYRKWIEARYNEKTDEYNFCHRERIYSFEFVGPPSRPVEQRYADWNAFVDHTPVVLDEFHSSAAFAYGEGVKPELRRRFVDELKQEPDIAGDIERMDRKYDQTLPSWDTVIIPVYNLLFRRTPGAFDTFGRRTIDFCNKQRRYYRYYYSLDSFFAEQMLKPRAGRTAADLNRKFGTDFKNWESVTLSRAVPEGVLRKEWIEFVTKWVNLRFVKVSPNALSAYQAFLENERYKLPADYRGKYKNGIGIFNERYGTDYKGFHEVPLPAEAPREGIPFQDWDQFVSEKLPAHPEWLTISSTEFAYRDFLKDKYETLERVIEAHKLGVQSFDELLLPPKLPESNTALGEDWLDFVKSQADLSWLTPDSAASAEWRSFLAQQYDKNGVADFIALNNDLGTDYRSMDDISVPLSKPAKKKLGDLWTTFVHSVCPRSLVVIDVRKAGSKWREFLRAKYGDIGSLNRAYSLLPTSFEAVALPATDVDYYEFVKNKRPAFWEFVKRNYAVVFDVMLYSGSAIKNTMVYCLMAIAGSLLVNPLAAYALSRYKPPSQYKLLLFLMLTMAFPVMVLGIPNFLMIRRLGLLNTYWALVLPGMANGYSIFLLKGFFDSLPKELYESAQIDGASEWTMFWRITMSTSTPILAVIALAAFQSAYANFMLAFILCQDPKRWTVMVHLYQLQQEAAQGVVFASLVVAAIPTLLVFILCQNVIMRGIVVPTEK